MPGGWEEIDSAEWPLLPTAPIPTGPEAPGDRFRVVAVNVMGIICEGDRVAVEDRGGGGVTVTMVNGASPAFGVPQYARVVDILPLGPDPAFGGAYNVRASQILYTDEAVPGALPWSDFESPNASRFRHGILLPNPLWEAHRDSRAEVGWRDWTEGVPSELVSSGRVVQQRKRNLYVRAKGTRTYFGRSTVRATGIHVANNELAFETAAAVPTLVPSGNVGTNGALAFAFTTPTGEPDSGAWPAGTYRFQFDVSATNLDLTYGLLTQGTSLGHFARVDSGLLVDLEAKVQVEGAFSLTGLKLATTGATNWLAGAASDRFEALLASVRVLGHGNATFTLEVDEADDFADGPWAAPTSAGDGALFFGPGLS